MSASPVQMSGLTIQTRIDHPTIIVAFSGQLLESYALQARNTLVDLLQEGPKRLVANLSDVTGLDTVGLGALVAASLWARRQNIDFAILPSPTVLGVLTETQMDRYLSLTESA